MQTSPWKLSKIVQMALLAWLAIPIAVSLKADDPSANPKAKPFDHGDDVNEALFTYKKDVTVPLHPPERPLAKFELKDKMYHGVLLYTDNQVAFEKFYKQYVDLVGKKPSMIGTFHARWSKGVEQPEELFLQRLKTIDTVPNVLPFMKIYTCDWVPSGPFMKADDILAGKDDAYFIHMAQMSKEFGKPFVLSINHEMNGDWFQYSEIFKPRNFGPTDWTAEKFVKVWQRIYKIFQDNGAANVAFAWCPGVQGRAFDVKDAQGKVIKHYDAINGYKAYYPGDAYVDWVGGSFYNDLNHYAIDNLAAAYPNKPLILAEWGTEPQRGQWYSPKPYPGDAQHMQMTFDFCTQRYPNMKAMTYFYWGKKVNIERVPEQVDVYRKGIANPIFKSND